MIFQIFRNWNLFILVSKYIQQNLVQNVEINK